MSDDPFEARLDHLFAVVDDPADALAFREALAGRLRRRRRARRLALLGASLLGAGVAGLATAPVLPRLPAMAEAAALHAEGTYGAFAAATQTALALTGVDLGHQGWTVAGLAVLALAGLTARTLERLGRI